MEEEVPRDSSPMTVCGSSKHSNNIAISIKIPSSLFLTNDDKVALQRLPKSPTCSSSSVPVISPKELLGTEMATDGARGIDSPRSGMNHASIRTVGESNQILQFNR